MCLLAIGRNDIVISSKDISRAFMERDKQYEQ